MQPPLAVPPLDNLTKCKPLLPDFQAPQKPAADLVCWHLPFSLWRCPLAANGDIACCQSRAILGKQAGANTQIRAAANMPSSL